MVVADGSIVQEHTGKGLDGLAPSEMIQPLVNRSWNGKDNEGEIDDEDPEGSVTPRLGAVINYTPTLILYVSQPFDDSIVGITLTTGGAIGNQIFTPSATRLIRSEWLNQPVDLAPVHTETENPNWSSNTKMQENSDFYVCNRGNTTVVRMRQDGSVVAVRRVRHSGRSLGKARLNGIATSPDHSKIWVSVVGHVPGSDDRHGCIIELPAF